MATRVSAVESANPPIIAMASGGQSKERDSARGRKPAIVVTVVITTWRVRSSVPSTTKVGHASPDRCRASCWIRKNSARPWFAEFLKIQLRPAKWPIQNRSRRCLSELSRRMDSNPGRRQSSWNSRCRGTHSDGSPGLTCLGPFGAK